MLRPLSRLCCRSRIAVLLLMGTPPLSRQFRAIISIAIHLRSDCVPFFTVQAPPGYRVCRILEECARLASSSSARGGLFLTGQPARQSRSAPVRLLSARLRRDLIHSAPECGPIQGVERPQIPGKEANSVGTDCSFVHKVECESMIKLLYYPYYKALEPVCQAIFAPNPDKKSAGMLCFSLRSKYATTCTFTDFVRRLPG